MPLYAIITLLSAVVILLAGFRIYLMERNNAAYQAFGLVCVNLSWMCFCWYEMEQTGDLATAQFYRKLQFVWALNNPLLVYGSWRLAEMHQKRISPWIYTPFFTLIILPGIYFAYLELFTPNGHGAVTLLQNGRWGLDIKGDVYTYLRGIWTILIMGSCLFLIYQVYRKERIPKKKRWLALLLLFFAFVIVSTVSKNYILPLQGKSQPLNESVNFALAILVMGWGVSDFRLFELKPESTFELVTGAMTNMLILVDQDLFIKKINPSTEAFFNLPEKEVRSQPLSLLVGKKAVSELFDNLDPTQKHTEQEIGFDRGDETATFLVTLSTIFSKRGKVRGYALVSTDLTPYYAAMEKVQEYNVKLESSNKALERFAYAASHDMKEPLRTIGGFAGLLKQEAYLTANLNIQEYVGFIDQGVRRMDAIIKSLLELSRLNEENPACQLIDLNVVITEIREKLHSLLTRKNARIIGHNLPEIYGNYGQLSLLFQNLIENGIKYNESASPEVSITALEALNGYEFSIRDNGIGINPIYKDQIFLMFKRLHSWAEYEGTGMGLAICKKIIDHLDGRIWLEPGNAEGSTFKLWIPEKKADGPSSSKTQPDFVAVKS
ncbi:MAG: PAS domain-containing protein [Lewinella sp.]|nr:PAS domain-containing protein [Lewinella sp.]